VIKISLRLNVVLNVAMMCYNFFILVTACGGRIFNKNSLGVGSSMESEVRRSMGEAVLVAWMELCWSDAHDHKKSCCELIGDEKRASFPSARLTIK